MTERNLLRTEYIGDLYTWITNDGKASLIEDIWRSAGEGGQDESNSWRHGFKTFERHKDSKDVSCKADISA